MSEKIGAVKNPLTIIAIFAGIAEVSGTGVLPFLSSPNQAIFMWFVMAFPCLLVIFFFLTLNFNHCVLYAPSDFRDEDNFIRSLPRATRLEKEMKIEAELATSVMPESNTQYSDRFRSKNIYKLIEDFVFSKLREEFETEIRRDVKLGAPGHEYVFDGVVVTGKITLVEIFMIHGVSDSTSVAPQIEDKLDRIQSAITSVPPVADNCRVLFIVVIDGGGSFTQVAIANQLHQVKSQFPFSFESRLHLLSELKSELGI